MSRQALTRLLEAATPTPPEDDFPNETVIRFKHRYDHPSPGLWYTYVAFKVDGAWFLTGKQTAARDWESLLAFMSRGQTKGIRISNAKTWDTIPSLIAKADSPAASEFFYTDTEKERD